MYKTKNNNQLDFIEAQNKKQAILFIYSFTSFTPRPPHLTFLLLQLVTDLIQHFQRSQTPHCLFSLHLSQMAAEEAPETWTKLLDAQL